MGNLTDDLLKRVILSKYLLSVGDSHLRKPSELFAAGLAVSTIQDAIETFLRAVAAHVHATVKDQEQFHAIIDKVEEKTGKPVKYRTALNELNRTRVSFKHFALEPKIEDAQRLYRDTEQFFREATQDFLAINPDSISVVGLVGHKRTENWLNKAQAGLEVQSYEAAIADAATAFQIYRRRSHKYLAPAPAPTPRIGQHEFDKLIASYEKRLSKLEEMLDLQIAGIQAADYIRFRRISPIVNLAVSGNREVIWNRTYVTAVEGDDPSESTARFCIDFVMSSIFAMKRVQPDKPRYKHLSNSSGKVRVTHSCKIVVWPSDNPEVVADAEPGDILDRAAGSIAQVNDPNHTAVSFQDEDVWVPSDCVKSEP
jgi:hypothetical protein